jgi:hypothetical protein
MVRMMRKVGIAVQFAEETTSPPMSNTDMSDQPSRPPRSPPSRTHSTHPSVGSVASRAVQARLDQPSFSSEQLNNRTPGTWPTAVILGQTPVSVDLMRSKVNLDGRNVISPSPLIPTGRIGPCQSVSKRPNGPLRTHHHTRTGNSGMLSRQWRGRNEMGNEM